jgi:Tfp pilus assembly protein PilF
MSSGNNREYLQAEELYEDAEEAFESGDFQTAENHLRNVIEKNPHFSYAYRLLAEVHSINGRNPDAVRILDKCLKIDPGFADAHYLMAKYRFKSGDMDGSAKSLSEAIRLSPHSRLYTLVRKNLTSMKHDQF